MKKLTISILLFLFAGHAQAGFREGMEFYSRADYSDAEREFISAAPENRYAYYLLGIIYENRQEFEKAEDNFDKYLESDDAQVDMVAVAQAHAAFVKAKLGKWAEARALIYKTRALAGLGISTRFTLADAMLEIGEKQKDAQVLADAAEDFLDLTLTSKKTAAINGFGRAKLSEFFLSPKFSKADLILAIGAFSLANNRVPGQAQYANNLGVALYAADDWLEAQRLLEAAVTINPGFVNSKINLAQLKTAMSKEPEHKNMFIDLEAATKEMQRMLSQRVDSKVKPRV